MRVVESGGGLSGGRRQRGQARRSLLARGGARAAPLALLSPPSRLGRTADTHNSLGLRTHAHNTHPSAAHPTWCPTAQTTWPRCRKSQSRRQTGRPTGLPMREGRMRCWGGRFGRAAGRTLGQRARPPINQRLPALPPSPARKEARPLNTLSRGPTTLARSSVPALGRGGGVERGGGRHRGAAAGGRCMRQAFPPLPPPQALPVPNQTRRSARL